MKRYWSKRLTLLTIFVITLLIVLPTYVPYNTNTYTTANVVSNASIVSIVCNSIKKKKKKVIGRRSRCCYGNRIVNTILSFSSVTKSFLALFLNFSSLLTDVCLSQFNRKVLELTFAKMMRTVFEAFFIAAFVSSISVSLAACTKEDSNEVSSSTSCDQKTHCLVSD